MGRGRLGQNNATLHFLARLGNAVGLAPTPVTNFNRILLLFLSLRIHDLQGTPGCAFRPEPVLSSGTIFPGLRGRNVGKSQRSRQSSN